MSPIPYGRQDITPEDIAEVVAVLRSDWLTQGPTVEKFEQSVLGRCGARFGVAVNSATSALHIACQAIGLAPGTRMWTSPNTFVASANAAVYCGAEVEFVDIDARTYNMSAEALAAKLAQASRAGRLPHVVMPVHFAGQSCDMRAIARLAQQYGFAVIEDASHAIGARYLDRPVGDCAYSAITVFSFHPVKIITTGEGGMAVTNDAQLAERMRLLRSHGVTREASHMEGASHGAWYYQQIDLGFNYRMTDIQAALGVSQMRRLDQYLRARHAVAQRYEETLSGLPVIRPWQDPHSHSALHLYPVQIDTDKTRVSRSTVFTRMRERGIGVNVHYIPVHTQPYYRRRLSGDAHLPVAQRYYERAMSLPMFATLDLASQDRVVAALRESLS